MLWENDTKKFLKEVLLDFFMRSMNDFYEINTNNTTLQYRKDYIDDLYCNYQPLKDLLLEFMIMCQNNFKDKDPANISIKNVIDYIDDFCSMQHDIFEPIEEK
jgi:hypothetical protein